MIHLGRNSSELPDTILLNTEYCITESWTWIYWILLLLIHVCGAKYHTEWSTHHVMWWALPLGSVGVPLGSTRSGEWSKVSHEVKYTPRDVVGVTSRVRGGTSWVHKPYPTWYTNGVWRKVHTELSTHHVMWWGAFRVRRGTSWVHYITAMILMFSCSHVFMFSWCRYWTKSSIQYQLFQQ